MQSSHDDEFAIGTRGNYRDGRHFELSDGSSQIQPGSLLYDAESGETRRIPRRTCAAAIILLMLGVIMLFTSLAFFVEGHPGYKAFGILGAIGEQIYICHYSERVHIDRALHDICSRFSLSLRLWQ
jgi:hypothetical protein